MPDDTLKNNLPEGFSEHLDASLISKISFDKALEFSALPMYIEDNQLHVITSNAENHEMITFFKTTFNVDSVIVHPVKQRSISLVIEHFFKKEILNAATYDLAINHPDISASTVFTKPQKIFFISLLIIAIAWSIIDFTSFVVAVIILALTLSSIVIAFQIIVYLQRSKMEDVKYTAAFDVSKLTEADLPIYTILVPVYKEVAVVNKLIRNLSLLDYPKEKLEVIILLEEDDKETLDAIKNTLPPEEWRLLVVPPSYPKTKPKACAYGLYYATGKYLTIFDAEDRPEPDQLKKACAAHNFYGEKLFCLQASLNYFNRDENLLTKFAFIDYSFWFDYVIPGLAFFDLPVPLGGTSNHFNVKNLKICGGWDPFNTTEDADLGIRSKFLGYNVRYLDSTTWEEANTAYWNTVRQRSRWEKGYMQTSLVYNRHPIKFFKRVGWKNWASFQLIVTASPLGLLLTPITTALVIILCLLRKEFLYDPMLVFLLLFSVMSGLLFRLYGAFQRKSFELIPYAFAFLIKLFSVEIVAGVKALWQLIFYPYYWEKTNHGLSKQADKGEL